jgi:hypothetical protein
MIQFWVIKELAPFLIILGIAAVIGTLVGLGILAEKIENFFKRGKK